MGLHIVKCALTLHIEMVNLGAGLEDTRQRTKHATAGHLTIY